MWWILYEPSLIWDNETHRNLATLQARWIPIDTFLFIFDIVPFFYLKAIDLYDLQQWNNLLQNDEVDETDNHSHII